MCAVKEIVVSELAEDLTCASYCGEESLLAFGGALGVGYVYSLAGSKDKDVRKVVALESDDEKDKVEGLVRLNGHFKQIDCI